MTAAASWAIVLPLLGVAAAVAVGASYVMGRFTALVEAEETPLYDWEAEGDFPEHRPVPFIGARNIAVGCTCHEFTHVEPIRLGNQLGAWDAALGAYWDEHGNLRGAVA